MGYLYGVLWEDEEVTVMGLNRFKSKYILEKIPLAWIENIRFSKTFDPRVLELMENNIEHRDIWWLYKEEDKKGAEEYAQILQRVKDGDKESLARYTNDVMERFYFR